MPAGRPTKTNEIKVRDLALSAIKKKYGSEEKGFIALLESGEAALIKFVFEHGMGKPRENVNMEHSGGVQLIFEKAPKGIQFETK